MINRIKIIFKDKGLRNKILFVLLVLVLFRIGSSIPIPGVDHARLSAFCPITNFSTCWIFFRRRVVQSFHIDAWCRSLHYSVNHNAVVHYDFSQAQRAVSGRRRILRQKFNQYSGF